MARYTMRATNSAGLIQFQERLTLGEALKKAEELRDAHFEHITLINHDTGIEITDLDALIPETKDDPQDKLS